MENNAFKKLPTDIQHIFTDDDLQRYKSFHHGGHQSDGTWAVPLEELRALLARLEAAEKWADTQKTFQSLSQEDFDTSDGDGYVIKEMMDECEKEWRKSAGK